MFMTDMSQVTPLPSSGWSHNVPSGIQQYNWSIFLVGIENTWPTHYHLILYPIALHIAICFCF